MHGQTPSLNWVNTTLGPFIDEEGVERHVLFADNLTVQTTDQFKECETKGVIWYGIAGAIDLWQPVNVGLAQIVKVLIGKGRRNWLDIGNAMERRILLTQWEGNACEEFTRNLQYTKVF